MLNIPRFVAEKMATTVRGRNVSLQALDRWLDEADIHTLKESLPTGAKITGAECKHFTKMGEGRKGEQAGHG